jgi:hypothetical protein
MLVCSKRQFYRYIYVFKRCVLLHVFVFSVCLLKEHLTIHKFYDHQLKCNLKVQFLLYAYEKVIS